MHLERLLQSADGRQTLVIVLDTGDEVVSCLTQAVEAEGITAASVNAIGAFERLVLGYFDWETKSYERIDVDEQVEVASLAGNVGRLPDGSPKLHLHGVVARRDGSTVAGHLMEAHVRPTLEVIVEEVPRVLARAHDPESGLALIRVDRRGR